MDKKLEHRIARLEKVMSRKNEQMNGSAAEAVYHTANQISQLCKELATMLKSTGDAPWEIDNALSMCEDDFPKVWFDRLNRINNDR
jgi:type II secretory pathway component PulF